MSTFLAWSPDDQDVALAWAKLEADRCPGCGHALTDTTDHEQRTTWAGDSLTCHACRAVAHARGDDDGADHDGRMWFAARR